MRIFNVMFEKQMRVVCVAGALAVCSVAWGFQNNSASEREPDAPPDLLAGPDIDGEAADANNNAMTTTREQNARRLNRASIPPRLWIREARKFDLTSEQRATMESILAEFEAAQRAHLEEHGAELREISSEFRQKRNGDIEIKRELGKRVQELRELAPNFEDYQHRIWDELTPPQREELTQRLEMLQKQLEVERENRRQQGRRQRDRVDDRAQRDSVPMGVNSPSLDAFDELGRRRLRFLMHHKKAGTEGDLDIVPQRRLPAPPPPRIPPMDE